MIAHNMDQADETGPARKSGNAGVGPSFRVAQVQGLGRGMAHLAHDVQNHLATISEWAGLVKDLARLKSGQRFGWVRQFFRFGRSRHLEAVPFLSDLDAIQEQVVQASALNLRLSSFAHRLEEMHTVLSGNKALEEIQDALLRDAGEKGVHLEIKLAATEPMIETDPLGFQLAVLCCVEQALRGIERGSRVVLQTEAKQALFQVHVTHPHPEEATRLSSQETDRQDFCQDIVHDVGGRIWTRSDGGKYLVSLTFPLAGGKT